MSGVKLAFQQESWVEVQAECKTCGLSLLSETTLGAWQDRGYGTGKRIVVKVQPCARCAREAKEIEGATNRKEGIRS